MPRSTPAIRALKATAERPSASPQTESTVPHRSATRLSALLSNSPPSSVHYCAISIEHFICFPLSSLGSVWWMFLFVCVCVCLMKCLIDLNMMYVFCSINGFGYFFFFFSFLQLHWFVLTFFCLCEAQVVRNLDLNGIEEPPGPLCFLISFPLKNDRCLIHCLLFSLLFSPSPFSH